MSGPLEKARGGRDRAGPLAGCSVRAAGGGHPRYSVRGAAGHADWWRPLPAGVSAAEATAQAARLLHLVTPGLLHVRGARLVQTQLYLITEELPHPHYRSLAHLIAAGRPFRESFVWSVLHQLAKLAHALQTTELDRCCRKRFQPEHIFVDVECQIKVDPFDFISEDSTETVDKFPPCSNEICSIGAVLYEMCTFKPFSKTDQPNFNYSADLKNMIFDLLHENDTPFECISSASILLHHPIVFSYLDDSKEMYFETSQLQNSTPSNDSAFESDESAKMEALFSTSNLSNIISDRSPKINESNSTTGLSPTIAALDLKIPGYVPRKISENVRKWRSRLELYKEPQEVSEDALSKVWLDRLKTLKDRETAVELKEKEFAKKILFDEIRSKINRDEIEKEEKSKSNLNIPGITLQTVMNEKLLIEGKYEIQNLSETKNILPSGRDSIDCPSRTVRHKPRRRSTSKGKCNKRRTIMSYDDLDSSLSADPGDSSVIMTSGKISSNTRRPSGMYNLARKKVHFNSHNNPFAEYDSISGTVFTFDDKNDESYVVPVRSIEETDNVINRIAKFTYLDLEAMTHQKRASLEEWRKSTPKMKLIEPKIAQNDFHVMKAPPAPVDKKTTRKSKYLSPRFEKCSSTTHVNYYSSNSESSGISVLSLPCSSQMKDRRKSMPFLSMNRNHLYSKVSKKNDTSENKENSSSNSLNANVESVSRTCYNLRSSKSVKNIETVKTEITKTPAQKEKRRSIFNFKTPFKFQL